MTKKNRAVLVLQDGTIFEGYSFGFPGDTSGEVVFNTSMMGYQEILTDPSYKGQIVTMTYPMIGNYGVNPVDVESARPHVEGFIVKEYSEVFSNFRAAGSLGDYLFRHRIVGIEGIDTRSLVRHIRDHGAQPGLISTTEFNIEHLKGKATALPGMEGQDLVGEVTCKKSYTWDKPTIDPRRGMQRGRGAAARPGPVRKVVAYDFGIKQNILRNLVEQGCEVIVVPAQTTAKEVLALKPDGVFLSNGPGDPAALHYAIENTAKLAGKVPLFGICLGHQILGLSQGAKTFKLKFGHRGGNQPIKNLATGHVEIASHNHGFAITKDSVEKAGGLTHLNLNDDTVAGFSNPEKKFFAVQYHPEASPGPHDSLYLFKQFRELMDKN